MYDATHVLMCYNAQPESTCMAVYRNFAKGGVEAHVFKINFKKLRNVRGGGG